MGRKTGRITRDLRARRKKLLKRYDPEELHQLRVDIRRLRSLLKLADTEDAARLRKAWGRIAERTNPARDWDTFVEHTESVLDSGTRTAIDPLLQGQLRRAHKRVLKTLVSSRWDAAFKTWQAFEQCMVGETAPESAFVGHAERARRRVDTARALALARDDDASWHRLRIAVKELRYSLDNLQVASPAEQRQLWVEMGLCKKLQAGLGDWHDSVVHSGLAKQLAEMAASNSNARAARASQELAALIDKRRLACLETARATLSAYGDLFAHSGAGKPSPGHEIERKFLVDPEALGSLTGGKRIVQGYVETRGPASVRVRLAGEHAFLTVKGPRRGCVRSEFEYPIAPEDAQRMLDELCNRPLIAKTRYRRECQGHTWEIDVFEEDNAGLILAEVELTSATDEPELPAWVTREVTDDPRYYNANLARQPFSEWGAG